MAAGYLAQPELSAARFVSNPLLDVSSSCGRQLQALGIQAAEIHGDPKVFDALRLVAARRA